ncbi:molybdate ABC transporter substrate-binding protein [Peribacillus loiseleuriae]|uniref:Molybdenum ABC transporter substrate-binding protein n=1 Tax=Peribacillus loiseleuriae TaxID=1679170 RepID=A0A0K9GW08_9BACI|nr:molybdate ABC transporter substrate-binding protein [Peribacillus loiseleuriae]KMY50432.1 hypothetical protein AC625_13745 [Peribacillus loiseleuriae]
MMKIFFKPVLMFSIILLLFISGCKEKQEKVELTISAAASLKDSMDAIQAQFEKEHPNISLTFNYGGSGMLQKQIEQGAPVDVFLSAAEQNYQALEEENMLIPEMGGPFTKNALVVIAPTNKKYASFNDLIEKGDKIAIGIPETVPAGAYAKETLQKIGKWEEIQDKLVLAKDVRQVLTLVEQQNVSGGIVYQSDAASSVKLNIIEKIDPSLHSEIQYYGGVVANRSNSKEASLFIDFLHNSAIQKIFVENGFIPITSK